MGLVKVTRAIPLPSRTSESHYTPCSSRSMFNIFPLRITYVATNYSSSKVKIENVNF